MLGAAKDVSPAFKGSSFRIKLSFNSQPSSLGLVGLLEACAAMVHQGFSFRIIAPRLLLDPKISSLAVPCGARLLNKEPLLLPLTAESLAVGPLPLVDSKARGA